MIIIDLYETDKKDYFMDIDGNAYSTKLDRIYKLKKSRQKNGYEVITVVINGKKENVLIHRLMGNAHLGLDLKSKMQMNHINKIRHCNELSNLEVVTPRQNVLHSFGYEDYKQLILLLLLKAFLLLIKPRYHPYIFFHFLFILKFLFHLS